MFWFTDIVSALDTLSRMDRPTDSPRIRAALDRLRELQRPDGTFAFRLMKGKDRDLTWWITLAVCRSLARWPRVGR